MNHKEIIQNLLDISDNKRYLEIGVASGSNFMGITAKYKVGVDPIEANELLSGSMNDNCIYHSLTSDDFFNKVVEPNTKFDVIFIDGLHEYKQAYRDIVNALEHLSQDGYIVVHDCKPMYEVIGLPPRMYKLVAIEIRKAYGWAWTGDVWKAIVELRSFHDDLFIFTLDCDFGCAVITKREPESMLSFSQLEIKAMDFDDLAGNYERYLNLKAPEYFTRHLGDLWAKRIEGKTNADAGVM